MKFFKRKKASKENVSPSVETSDSEQEFYTQPAGEEPLNEFSDGSGRQTRRTSLHSPARRRENNNRAGNKEILLLFFRAGLIVFLLAAGFFVLKLGLGKLAEPSEKEQQQWVANAELMENAIAIFYKLRELDNIEKKPATRELINWTRALEVDPDFKPKQLLKGDVPYLGILFKKSQDYASASNITTRRRLI